MSKCKYCGKEVEDGRGKMANHVRHGCPAKPSKNGRPATPLPTFDPVALIESLDKNRIIEEINRLDARKRALSALLTVAEANQPGQ